MSDIERVTVQPGGKGFRVVEPDGEPCMNGRSPSDGGGLPDLPAAWQLADRINARRKRRAA